MCRDFWGAWPLARAQRRYQAGAGNSVFMADVQRADHTWLDLLFNVSNPKAVVIWELSWGTWFSIPKNCTSPAASSRGSCLSSRSRGEADIFLDLQLLQSNVSSLCANPSSSKAYAFKQYTHYHSLPLFIHQKLQHQVNNYLHQPKSLGDLNICTQHLGF